MINIYIIILFHFYFFFLKYFITIYHIALYNTSHSNVLTNKFSIFFFFVLFPFAALWDIIESHKWHYSRSVGIVFISLGLKILWHVFWNTYSIFKRRKTNKWIPFGLLNLRVTITNPDRLSLWQDLRYSIIESKTRTYVLLWNRIQCTDVYTENSGFMSMILNLLNVSVFLIKS